MANVMPTRGSVSKRKLSRARDKIYHRTERAAVFTAARVMTYAAPPVAQLPLTVRADLLSHQIIEDMKATQRQSCTLTGSTRSQINRGASETDVA
jgi:hypothetical protein